MHSERVYLPANAKDIKVEFSHSDTNTMITQGIIHPSPTPIAPTMLGAPEYASPDLINSAIYSNKQYGESFKYDIGFGLNGNDRAVVVDIKVCPATLSSVVNGDGNSVVEYFTSAKVTVTYTLGSSLLASPTENNKYDMLILSPSRYLRGLQPLVDHKNSVGIKTKLISLNDIYSGKYFELSEQYSHDDQEKIKWFIYSAILEWDVKYVMLVGGYRAFFGLDRSNVQFPIRYSHFKGSADDEPGYCTDAYYGCCINYMGDVPIFDSWDSNGNGIYAENADKYDLHPDVAVGRLACRNTKELKTMVDKIIYYETHTYGQDWFKNMLTVTGDGFADFGANGIMWDVSSLPNGRYTIHAQSSRRNDPDFKGPIDNVTITVDHSAASRVSFNEDDHLKIKPLDYPEHTSADFPLVYPGYPVAEIAVPDDGDILGNTDVKYQPPEAYIEWANVNYQNGVLKLQTKSYDPRPHDFTWNPPSYPERPLDTKPSQTILEVWVTDSSGATVFGPVTKNAGGGYWEGECECEVGHQYVMQYLPEFKHVRWHTSNGNWTTMWSVLQEFSKGFGLVYFAGHSSPMAWGDHYPGIPGGRDDGQANGIAAINMRFGLERYAAEAEDPLFPIDQLTNGNKLPVVVLGGCHSAAFDTSMMKLLQDPQFVLFGDGYGKWIPEGFAWWLTRIPQGGSIATMGYGGLGYGYLGLYNINGLTGWMSGEIFRVYAEDGVDILGDVFRQAKDNYATQFGVGGADRKTLEEFLLLGDPSLKIGGYPSKTGKLQKSNIEIGDIIAEPGHILSNITNNGKDNLTWFDWEIKVSGDSPLGRWFGSEEGKLLYKLLTGRVLSGESTTGREANLKPDETLELQSDPVFGIGHILVNISVSLDDEVLAYKTEDGFLLGSQFLLYRSEE